MISTRTSFIHVHFHHIFHIWKLTHWFTVPYVESGISSLQALSFGVRGQTNCWCNVTVAWSSRLPSWPWNLMRLEESHFIMLDRWRSCCPTAGREKVNVLLVWRFNRRRSFSYLHLHLRLQLSSAASSFITPPADSASSRLFNSPSVGNTHLANERRVTDEPPSLLHRITTV